MCFAAFMVACQSSPSSTSQEDAALVVPEQQALPTSPLQRELDSLNAAIVDAPNDLSTLEARASLYLRQQNLKYASADIDAVLQVDSSRTKALELLGDLGFLTNQTRQSRDAWVKCMKADPQNVSCRLKLAELYHVVTEFEKSAELVDKVIAMDPDNAEAHFLKGMLMRDAIGDTTLALEWFQKSIDLDPEYKEALDMCGVLYSALGNPLALGYFNRLIELDPDNRVSYYNRGMYFLGQDQWNGALEDFTTCVSLDPRDLESYFNLGYIHLQLQLPSEARGYFNRALEIQPINHRALYGRGYCFELLGDLPNAEKDYRQALSYNPSHAGSQAGLQRITTARRSAN